MSVHHKSIQRFGNYRVPSREKTGRRRCPDRGHEECQLAPKGCSGCLSKGGLLLQLDTPWLPWHFSSLYWEDSVIVDIVIDIRASHSPWLAFPKWLWVRGVVRVIANGHSLKNTPWDASAFKYRVLFDTWTNWAMKSESLCMLFMNGLPCLSTQEVHCHFLLWT